MVRICTRTQSTTEDKEDVKKYVKKEILATHAIQQQATFAMKGNVKKAAQINSIWSGYIKEESTKEQGNQLLGSNQVTLEWEKQNAEIKKLLIHKKQDLKKVNKTEDYLLTEKEEAKNNDDDLEEEAIEEKSGEKIDSDGVNTELYNFKQFKYQ